MEELKSVYVSEYGEIVAFYVIDHDDECECWYDDEGEVVEYCNKNVCPNL